MQTITLRRETLFRPPLARFYREVRDLSCAIAAPLSAEDQAVQSMPDASPVKWHLAHTTWFFERMLLASVRGYEVFDERYEAIFNSYYLALGTPFRRAQRGLLTRPGVTEIAAYREHVDAAMERLLHCPTPERRAIAILGLNHEQQHQELMLTDIKHAFFCNPLLPCYRPGAEPRRDPTPSLDWIEHEGGIVETGHCGEGFAFDNEAPRHQRLLQPFRIASRPVTCGEYRAFIDDGGYSRPELWLSDGWALKETEGWRAPLYWLPGNRVFTLHGERPINPGEPVSHVSYYEASAFAAWAGKRLPTEFEWEAAAERMDDATGAFFEFERLCPRSCDGEAGMLGNVWAWTRSSYDAYPGFKPFDGALGEYNGKFMVGQMVLRGGSCVTPQGHVRTTYRNFFPPSARWQFSGIRLAEDT